MKFWFLEDNQFMLIVETEILQCTTQEYRKKSWGAQFPAASNLPPKKRQPFTTGAVKPWWYVHTIFSGLLLYECRSRWNSTGICEFISHFLDLLSQLLHLKTDIQHGRREAFGCPLLFASHTTFSSLSLFFLSGQVLKAMQAFTRACSSLPLSLQHTRTSVILS